MPYKAKVSCKHPGCPNLIECGKRYCKEHNKLHDRGTRLSKGMYTARGDKQRKAYLRAHPLCVRCFEDGRTVKATVVDHIKPHRGNKELFGDKSNWQSLCKQCHDKKTFHEDRREVFSYDF